jgi:hypothetical protein
MSIDKATLERISKQHEEIRNGILNVTMAWAGLENHMAILLETIVGVSDKMLGFAIYFAPGGAETRFSIVDAAMTVAFRGLPHSLDVFEEWKEFFGMLATSRGKRNTIIHGNVLTVFMNGKNHARLTAPMLDPIRGSAQYNPPNLPGYSGKDILAIAQRMWDLDQQVSRFIKTATAFKNGEHAALPQIVAELKEHRLKLAGHSKAGQNPPKRKAPPRPSRG